MNFNYLIVISLFSSTVVASIDQQVLASAWQLHSLSCNKLQRTSPEKYQQVLVDAAQLQGRRPYMEDRIDIKKESDHVFAAVYDGHGGSYVADKAQERLYAYVVNSGAFNTSSLHALREGCLMTEESLDLEKSWHTGSVVVAVLIKDNRIYTAWLGDSRAILARNGTALQLTSDHTPKRRDECVRVREARGSIVNGRVQGLDSSLAVTRALGDAIFGKHVVSSDPETRWCALDSDDEFLLLASDGLFERMSNQEAVQFIKEKAQADSADPYKGVAGALVAESYKRGSGDNISAIIVNLRNLVTKASE